jgi:PD-(D/E)XK endonuclease
MAPLKKKGDFGELKVAADLVARGCSLYIPFGEDSDYDLIADFEGRLHRVQVKYTQSDGRVIIVRTRSHSLTAGKIRATKHHNTKTVDWIAVYDATTDHCYYVASWILGTEGINDLRLRLLPARNGQLLRVRRAEDYLDPDFSRDPSVEPAGFEPAASSVQGRRSAN